VRPIRPLPEFTAWLDDLADAAVRGVVLARIKRLELGLPCDVKSVGSQERDIRRARALAASPE
jgi:putative component of toxin-antitoxin plasmid stabilization module